MTDVLVTKIKLRSPIKLTRIPAVARLHRAATRQRASRKAQLVITAPLEKLFQWYYRWVRVPASGQMEYHGPAGPRTITFNARNLAFDILYSDLFAENYEDETAALLDTVLPKGGCFYDIGSNWGFFSLYTASRGDGVKIHAFEPIPSTYADLVHCIDQAGLNHQVTSHNMAVSEADGELVFQVPFHSASAQAGNDGRIGSDVKVQTAKIDSLALDRPDFIKIDAEGHEAAVLKGGLATLRSHKPFLMFENKLYRPAPRDTLQPLLSLRDLGYRLFVPCVKRACDGATYFVNCGYQIDTGRMQQIQAEDTLALVPLEPSMRFLLPSYLNIFGCHEDRMNQLRERFESAC